MFIYVDLGQWCLLIEKIKWENYVKYLAQYLASGKYSLLFSGGSIESMDIKRFKGNKGEFRKDDRSQAIFLGSNCKTLIVSTIPEFLGG